MTTRNTALAGMALFAVCLSGCSFYNEVEQAEYDKTYAAMNEVLSKYFNVRESQFVEGHVIAYSRISNQFGEMQRYKVDAWVDRDVEGFFHPHLQVFNEQNMSVVNANKNSRGQPSEDWRAVGHNRKLETQLLNEIHDALGYDTGSVNADWYDTDLKHIERQKKIDEARASYQAKEQR